MEYLIYQELGPNSYLIYSYFQKKSKVIDHTEFVNIKIPKYYKFKTDNVESSAIEDYAEIFEKWRVELLNEGIDILKSRELPYLVMQTYLKYCDLIKDMPVITAKEHSWFEKLNLGSAMYFDETVKNEPLQSYSYDFKSFYNKSMSSKAFEIPNCVGVETKIEAIPSFKEIECGIYNVRITSNDKNFKKIFAFSEDHCYTDVTLKNALLLQKKYPVEILLNTKAEYNCLLYDKTIRGEKLFLKHFEALSFIKDKYPGNKLAKFLLSSLNGHLNQKNIKSISSDDIANYDLSADKNGTSEYVILNVTNYFDKAGELSEYLTIAKRNQVYKHNVRLYPWLISFTRNKTFSLAQEDLDNVIRIQTDSVSFRKPMTFDKPHLNSSVLLPEAKSTGLIKWSNINTYAKQCSKCSEWIRVSKMSQHNC